MFKKLKDKLAEEVKSSPQRIQQFAQAAQAAVTSASSSISDITNSDLFSIGDNDPAQMRPPRPQSSPNTHQTTFQDVSLMQSPSDSMDYTQDVVEGQRQRRLSNSSFASDVSFRLPSYETPSMYHLQSDMEVSASEADERGFAAGPATLDRVTKEQLYAAYKRTQERYKKYRTQYGDLARHYKLLERENAKARSVLVETQDKALRRISELKEQCSLEQSAKAHLEKALRFEIEEKNMKIETLNTKIQLLQNDMPGASNTIDSNFNHSINDSQNNVQLINLDNSDIPPKLSNDDVSSEIVNLNSKIEKMEQLINKYKESLKANKEKNAQIATEIQILSKELENKNKQIEDFKTTENLLKETKSKLKELTNQNEELQNQINTFDFTKTKELSTLELDLQKANEEIAELHGKIEVFTKREEENAISLAENKLSIHKELESKEAEIKSLKDHLAVSNKEIQSLKIVVEDYKHNISVLEEERHKLSNDCAELSTLRIKFNETETKWQELTKKFVALEQLKAKTDEEYKCLQLQLKQETAEKLAMIDRNGYLETKNTQLLEENSKKTKKISSLENDLEQLAKNKDHETDLVSKETENDQSLEEVKIWKDKCDKLEREIQEEREELVKLQTEIEKLLSNHELIQNQNAQYRSTVNNLKSECSQLKEDVLEYKSSLSLSIQKTVHEIKALRQIIQKTSEETKINLDDNNQVLASLSHDIDIYLSKTVNDLFESITAEYNKLKIDNDNLQKEIAENILKVSDATNNLCKSQEENLNLKLRLKENESKITLLNDKINKGCTENVEEMAKIKLVLEENQSLKKMLEEVKETSQKLHIALESEKAQHLASIEKIQSDDIDKENLIKNIETLESKLQENNSKIDNLTKQHKDELDSIKINHTHELTIKEKEIQNMSKSLQQEIDDLLKSEQKKISEAFERMNHANIENQELKNVVQRLESKNVELISEIEKLNKEHNIAIESVKILTNDIDNITKDLEKSKQDQHSLTEQIAQYKNETNYIQELKTVNQELCEKKSAMKETNNAIISELEELKIRHRTAEENVTNLNSILKSKSIECEEKQIFINNLEENVRILTQENIVLKTETSNFAMNINKLESEIDDIRKSHMEMEIEKDNLNKIIENLVNKEEAQSILSKDTKNTQTDINEDDKIKKEATTVFENKWILENKQTMMTNTASLDLQKDTQEDLHDDYCTLKLKCDTVKDENRRLKSDIEGLQTYLTKISKENSVLNDKLRELIATSEHSTDTDQLSCDINELRNDLQVSKEKINDLLRENSLLIEENLELKDQLQTQNYAKPEETKTLSHNDKDLDAIKSKYNDLYQVNSQLEKKNVDLEQINKSVSGNMRQLQDKNEKLKLSNEKLERRLDEALVSLQHLHSLQENTELEYLRNILYEYLTGSGTHSVTLAKVLAAIVKFDDVQTQMVLQKEKERQGFLRQLGII